MSIVVRLLLLSGRWVLSLFRSKAALTSASVLAGTNVLNQAIDHGDDWKRWNLKSVAGDFILGVIGYGVASKIFMRYPAGLFRKIDGQWAFRNKTVLRNLGYQQSFLILFQTALYSLTHIMCQRGTTKKEYMETGGAALFGHLAFFVQGQALQSFLFSARGKQLLPKGFNDPRVAAFNSLCNLAIRAAMRNVFDLVAEDKTVAAGAKVIHEDPASHFEEFERLVTHALVNADLPEPMYT